MYFIGILRKTRHGDWKVKFFPMLNDSVNTIRMPGKYYTLEEARDLVDFCKKHQVLLIPAHQPI